MGSRVSRHARQKGVIRTIYLSRSPSGDDYVAHTPPRLLTRKSASSGGKGWDRGWKGGGSGGVEDGGSNSGARGVKKGEGRKGSNRASSLAVLSEGVGVLQIYNTVAVPLCMPFDALLRARARAYVCGVCLCAARACRIRMNALRVCLPSPWKEARKRGMETFCLGERREGKVVTLEGAGG